MIATDPQDNLLTVRKSAGEQIIYDPSRLLGISAYRELEREFAVGDRLSFTAPNRELGVANRDLGKVEGIDRLGYFSVQMDNGKSVSFDAAEMRHFVDGYAVTSHSSQGLTAHRVLVNMDTQVHGDLINSRFAYVPVSRGSHEVQIFMDYAAVLAGFRQRGREALRR